MNQISDGYITSFSLKNSYLHEKNICRYPNINTEKFPSQTLARLYVDADISLLPEKLEQISQKISFSEPLEYQRFRSRFKKVIWHNPQEVLLIAG